MRVGVTMEPEPVIGRPELLFEGGYDNVNGISYDVTPDGERFLLLTSEAESTPSRIHVVLNWFEDLPSAVP